MNISETANPFMIEINDKPCAIVSRICSIDQSYPLACAAIDLELEYTTRDREPYSAIRFNRRSKAHKALPGSASAKESDFVFKVVIPLEKLKVFFDLAKQSSARLAA